MGLFLMLMQQLETIQKKYRKFVEIGSYPFFRLGKIGVSVVSRSTSKSKLMSVNKDLMKTIKVKKIKILLIDLMPTDQETHLQLSKD